MNANQAPNRSERTVVWWSAGAASTVAARLTLTQNPAALLVYCETGSEHDDNRRFLTDCERWLEKPILRIRSEAYRDIWDVFERTRFLVGPRGARCTTELKKKVRQSFALAGDVNVFGYTVEERNRIERFKLTNPEISVAFPVAEANLSHADCLALVERAGIELPKMYRLGYANNNCIGCVKGGAGYWNKIRRDFPSVFARMALVERSLGRTVLGDVSLDELSPERGSEPESTIECSLFCHTTGAEWSR